jgi:hypothetical protein
MNVETDSSNTEVEIRPEVTILSVLRYLNYEPWFAIAEFVDNSIQSYLANKSRLHAVDGPHFQLTIKIDIDTIFPGEIIITDNAAGIAAKDFARAFRPAQAPTDQSGLSEFGIGMKSAACWFASTWTVRTKALDESIERLIKFDIEKIVQNNVEVLVPTFRVVAHSSHYTTVVLRGLHHLPKGRTVGKMKDHLASIYRVFLRSGLLKIIFNREELQYQLPKILNSVPYRDVGQPDISPDIIPQIWKKEINLDFGQGQKVTGFVALRERASTSMAGFSLFRRNRLIEGSLDNTYRPTQIFKTSTSYLYQRLFGELHLEGFDVSHTKDGFRWEEFEDEFLDLLHDAIEAPPMNLIAQAENFRALPQRKSIQVQAIAATSNVAKNLTEVTKAVLVDARQNPSPAQILPTELLPRNLQASEQTVVVEDGDFKWIVTLRTSIDPAVEKWVSVARIDTPSGESGIRVRRLCVDLSLAHPFSMNYLGSANENIEVFLRLACDLCISLVLTEDLTAEPPQTSLKFFNKLLRGTHVLETLK